MAALAWGSADFIARFTGGALGYVNALLGMLVASAVVLSGIVWWLDLSVAEARGGWWLVLLAGAGVSYLIAHGALHRGMRPWKR